MKAYWGSGGIAPSILDIGTRWRWMVSFMSRSLYPQGKSLWYPLDRRLGGPQSRSRRGGHCWNQWQYKENEDHVAHRATGKNYRYMRKVKCSYVWRDVPRCLMYSGRQMINCELRCDKVKLTRRRIRGVELMSPDIFRNINWGWEVNLTLQALYARLGGKEPLAKNETDSICDPRGGLDVVAGR
jgi:hypothetical protein